MYLGNRYTPRGSNPTTPKPRLNIKNMPSSRKPKHEQKSDDMTNPFMNQVISQKNEAAKVSPSHNSELNDYKQETEDYIASANS